MVRFATWNVNSLKPRLPRVEEWAQYAHPDVLCLQETKLSDDSFPQLTFQTLGYDSVHHGPGQWNGVAILSRAGIGDVTSGFDGTELVDPYEGDAPDRDDGRLQRRPRGSRPVVAGGVRRRHARHRARARRGRAPARLGLC